MDYAPALPPLFDYIWYLIPLFILAAAIKFPCFKGKAGEAVVNFSAKLCLRKTRCYLIKNVALPTEAGTTQIDHIIVSRHGIFVGDATFKTPMPESVTHGGGHVGFIKAQIEQRLSTVEVQKVMEAIDCNNEARYLVTVRHANSDRCFTDHERKHNNQAKGLFMNVMLFPIYVLVVLLVCGNTVFADSLSYRDKAGQCSEHGYKLCWRSCLVAAKQQEAGQTVKHGEQCDAEHNKQFTHTPYQSKSDPDYLPSGSWLLGSDVVGIYRHNAGRSRHIIDAPSHPEWKEKCKSTVRIEPPMIKSLMKNGKTLQKGMKVHLSKIQVKAISGNRFECKAGKVEVLD